ncbi:hypothetical protein D3C87_1403180 [compost metagenome]
MLPDLAEFFPAFLSVLILISEKRLLRLLQLKALKPRELRSKLRGRRFFRLSRDLKRFFCNESCLFVFRRADGI